MTPKATEFMEHNRQHGICAGKRLPENCGPDKSDRCQYRFENGTTRTLMQSDIDALYAAGHPPRWVSG